MRGETKPPLGYLEFEAHVVGLSADSLFRWSLRSPFGDVVDDPAAAEAEVISMFGGGE